MHKIVNGKLKVFDGISWRTGKKWVCDDCGKTEYIRHDRKRISVCMKCRFSGKNNPRYGKRMDLSERKRRSVEMTGEKHWNWQGGITKLSERLRDCFDYNEWRKNVWKRDNYICQDCGKRDGKIHAHHIKPFLVFPELAYDVNNGLTLCPPCHQKTDTWGGRAKNHIKNKTYNNG